MKMSCLSASQQHLSKLSQTPFTLRPFAVHDIVAMAADAPSGAGGILLELLQWQFPSTAVARLHRTW